MECVFYCNKCKFRSVLPCWYKYHIDNAHKPKVMRTTMYKCDNCHREYYDKNTYLQHILNNHRSIKWSNINK